MHVTSMLFDTRYAPGVKVENGGIYCCIVCSKEIVVTKNGVLPPADHHSHEGGETIKWQLLVLAQ